ncbi:MAG: T9SS type A sorting domain-containing protein [Lewinellaceae bacterium]|nr:T9SS type A sorting domain-containing protein [Lewinellaceae bacterium]
MIKNPDGTSDTDVEVLKLNEEGAFVSSVTYGITSKSDRPNNILTASDGYIIASIRDNTNFAHQDIEARNHIFKVNEEGDILWEYFSPINELRGKEGRAIATSDGGLLVLTGQGIEFPAGPGFSELRWHNYVFKLDSSRQEEWGVLVRDSFHAISYNNQLTSGIEMQDGSGYAVAGNLIEGTPEDGLYFNGVLAKISPDGVLLWKRYYQHIPSQRTRHYINDLAQAPDGGFIMAGEVRDTVNAPRQQGWLLKVDEYGCLVPGCELVSSVEEPKSSDDSHAFAEGFGSRRKSSDDCTLLLYPNPVSEALQVYFTAPAGGEHHFRILDAQGREWRRFSTRLSEVTLLVEVGELPGGVYYLQCLREGKVVGVEGFVKR